MSNGSKHPRAAVSRFGRIYEVAELVSRTTPGFGRLHGNSGFCGWAAELERLRSQDALRPFSPMLGRLMEVISENDKASFMPALSEGAEGVSLDTLAEASRIAVEALPRAPHAGFVLAWSALWVWILGARQRGEELYEYRHPDWPDTVPHPGWKFMPAACAKAALMLQGLYGARLLVDEAHAVVQYGFRRRYVGQFAPVITDYRRLAETIEHKFDVAVANLAGDLQDACDKKKSMASTVAALLWAFGRVPEAHACLANQSIPGRWSLQRLIHASVSTIPADPLVQVLWAHVFVDGGVDQESHPVIAAIVTVKWNQWVMDHERVAGVYGTTSQIAMTLIKFLDGTLTSLQAREFLHKRDGWIDDALIFFGGADPAGVCMMQRLRVLGDAIRESFEGDGAWPDKAAATEHFRKMVEIARQGQEYYLWNPEVHGDRGRESHASFEFIERCLSDEADPNRPEQQRCEAVFETMERFRAGTLRSYALAVNPPVIFAPDDEGSRALMEEEHALLQRLRGAYFLALRPVLPLAFQTPLMSDEDALQSTSLLGKAAAVADAKAILNSSLVQVARKLEAQAPDYGLRRRVPEAGLARLVETLNLHTRLPAGIRPGTDPT